VTGTEAVDTHLVRWGPLRLDVEPGVYGTVVLMTVLVVALDDGIEDFAEAAQVILGPLLATFAAHLFASVLARVARQSAPRSSGRSPRACWGSSSSSSGWCWSTDGSHR